MLRRACGVVAIAALVGCFGDAAVGGPLTLSQNETSSGCSDDAPCEGGTPCAPVECVDGTCQKSFLPEQARIDDDVPGDCAVLACDGKGEILMLSDGSDVVDDGNPCTIEGCTPDGVQLAALPKGTLCGDHMCCDARGVCAGGECLADSDCPLPDSPCQTMFCNDCGFCEALVTLQGQVRDLPGDCYITYCGSTGELVYVEDPMDVPDDGDPCTIDTCEDLQNQTYGPMNTPLCMGPCYLGVCG